MKIAFVEATLPEMKVPKMYQSGRGEGANAKAAISRAFGDMFKKIKGKRVSLKQLLKEAKDDMDKLDDWMKSQEPAPGVSYEDWGKQETEKNERVSEERVHDKDGNLCCNKCLRKTSETYQGGLCSKCRDAKMIAKPVTASGSFMQKIMLSQQPMKNGDVRKLPKANSPLWTVQWSVMGTAKLPYVVSRNPGHANGATTSEGWACSCPNFTQHTPRTECKHILKVMQLENVKPASPPVASLPEDQQEAFRKFLLQQAERGTPARPAGKTKPLITQGRRFR